jgi:hypothetical protein
MPYTLILHGDGSHHDLVTTLCFMRDHEDKKFIGSTKIPHLPFAHGFGNKLCYRISSFV